MSNQTFYKLASFFMGIFCIVLVFLIITPFAESSDRQRQNMTFTDELRLHRELFMQIANSRNPLISIELKEICRHEIQKIDSYLYSDEEISIEQEMKLRQEIKMINWQIKNDPYYSNMNFHNANTIKI